jgi:hypothetical protein
MLVSRSCWKTPLSQGQMSMLKEQRTKLQFGYAKEPKIK